MTRPVSIVWFRRTPVEEHPHSRRLEKRRRCPSVCRRRVADGSGDDWRPGAASRWWLHHSLTALSETLESSDPPRHSRPEKPPMRSGDLRVRPERQRSTGTNATNPPSDSAGGGWRSGVRPPESRPRAFTAPSLRSGFVGTALGASLKSRSPAFWKRSSRSSLPPWGPVAAAPGTRIPPRSSRRGL